MTLKLCVIFLSFATLNFLVHAKCPQSARKRPYSSWCNYFLNYEHVYIFRYRVFRDAGKDEFEKASVVNNKQQAEQICANLYAPQPNSNEITNESYQVLRNYKGIDRGKAYLASVDGSDYVKANKDIEWLQRNAFLPYLNGSIFLDISPRLQRTLYAALPQVVDFDWANATYKRGTDCAILVYHPGLKSRSGVLSVDCTDPYQPNLHFMLKVRVVACKLAEIKDCAYVLMDPTKPCSTRFYKDDLFCWRKEIYLLEEGHPLGIKCKDLRPKTNITDGPCPNASVCAVDCEWTEWEKPKYCYNCRNGYKTRRKIREAYFGGAECTGETTQLVGCQCKRAYGIKPPGVVALVVVGLLMKMWNYAIE